jgi:nicotinic acid mononucleotide adenylyltransferase
VGLEELTTTKYVVRGDGQVRAVARRSCGSASSAARSTRSTWASALAEEAREQLGWTGCCSSEPRVAVQAGSAGDGGALRLEMVRAAVADNPTSRRAAWRSSAGGPSYTIDTVRALRAEYGQTAHLFLLTGSDAVRDIAQWREPDALLREVRVATAARPGVDPGTVSPICRRVGRTRTFIAMPAWIYRPRSVRARAGAGRSIRYSCRRRSPP